MATPAITERTAAVLACLRREKTYAQVAGEFGVSPDEVQRWESAFIAGGSSVLADEQTAPLSGQMESRRDKVSQMGALNAIGQTLTAILDLDQLLDTAMDNLHWVFGYAPTIALIEGVDLVVKGGYSLGGEKIPWHDWRMPLSSSLSMLAWAAANGRPLNVPDTSVDSRYVYQKVVGEVGSELVMPIIFKGTVLGAIGLSSGKQHAFDQDDTNILETIAFQLAVAIENARLFNTVRRRVAQLELVQAITAKAIEDLEVQVVLDFTVTTTRQILGYSGVAIGLINDGGKTMRVTSVAEPEDGVETPVISEMPIDDTTVMGSAAKSGQLALANEVRRDERFTLNPLLPSTQSELVVPMRSRGTLIGVINVESDRPGAFDDTDVITLTVLADQLIAAIRSAELFQKTQAQLREISLFRRLADGAIVGIITRDTDGVIDYINPAAAALFRYPDVTEMRGKPMRVLYPNDTWYEIDKQLCIQAMRDGGWSGEIMQLRNDGQTIIADMSVFPIYGPESSFMTFGTVLQDATERYHLLDAIQQANARFEAILQATEDGIIAWDESWRVLLVNPAACRMLHSAPEQLIGCTRDAAAAPAQLVRVANAREQERIDLTAEERLLVRCRNLRWQTEKASGHLTLIYDITSEVVLEESRQEMTSMLVHDLRGPLTSVVGGIEMAQVFVTENDDRERTLHFLNMAARSGKLLLNMANSLLDISKFESGRMTLERSVLQVEPLFQDVIGSLNTSAQTANIKLNTVCDENLPVLSVDVSMIRRALANLVDNAIKFTPDGGTVSLEAYRESDKSIRFNVADTGPGVPEAFRKRIFEKYGQIPGQKGRRRGTGLGLAFCRLVAEAHHGKVWVEPKTGGGSVFSLIISEVQETPAT